MNSFRIFQGYFTVQLSRFFVTAASATAQLEYHHFSMLSTTFLNFFQFFLDSRFFSIIYGVLHELHDLFQREIYIAILLPSQL